MECWCNVLSCTTPLLRYSITPTRIIAEVAQASPGVYGWLGLCGGYVLVMLFAPVRRALVDGLHCLGRYHRIWITFAVLGFGYFVFQFVTFTPIRNWADLELSQITSLPQWAWPTLSEIWTETLLPATRGRCGNFRQRHHHVSALRFRCDFDDCELARIARRLVARAAETVRLLGYIWFI